MTFSWLNKQGVASDQGFSLQSVGRFAFEYREADRIMRLEGESIVSGLTKGSFGFGFYPSWRDANWQPPFHTVIITASDRHRIIENVRAAIEFMGGEAVFD